MTIDQRLEKCVADILGMDIYVPLAGVIMLGKSELLDEPYPPLTACTNGRDVIYGKAFIEGLTDAEFRYLILHENYHKLDRHLHYYDYLWNVDARIAAMACDIWINNTLNKENEWIMANVPYVRNRFPDGFAVMPKGGLCDPSYNDWDIPSIFWDLHNKQEEGDGDTGAGGDAGAGAGTGDPSGYNEDGDSPFDMHDFEGAQELNDAEKEDLAREVDSAVRQGAMTAGKLGLATNRTIEEMLKPKVSWEKVSRDWAKQVCAGKDYSTWAKPNRRHMGQGVYMPTSLSDSIEHLVLAPDMSGSCFSVLPQWIGEFRKIAETLRPTMLHVVWWDTKVRGMDSFRQDELDNLDALVAKLKPKGGGGTDVRGVPTYLRQQQFTPTACAVLTDGELFGDWGVWDCPLLWCIANNANATPPMGKVVHIEV